MNSPSYISPPGERWAPVTWSPGTSVSDQGRVVGKRGAILTHFRHAPNFYPRVHVSTGGGKTRFVYVHRLVYEAFNGPIPPGMEVAHLDGNKDNPALTNLSLEDTKGNMAHKVLHDTRIWGEGSCKAKLSLSQVEEVKNLFIPWSRTNGAAALAARYGVTRNTIVNIVHGNTWISNKRKRGEGYATRMDSG